MVNLIIGRVNDRSDRSPTKTPAYAEQTDRVEVTTVPAFVKALLLAVIAASNSTKHNKQPTPSSRNNVKSTSISTASSILRTDLDNNYNTLDPSITVEPPPIKSKSGHNPKRAYCNIIAVQN
jgi:hypothetical protein